MDTMKRLVAMILCLTLTLALFGCGQASDGQDGGQKNGETNTKDTVYVPEYKELGIDYLSTAVLEGDAMYYLQWQIDETTQKSSETLCRMDLNTLESTEIPFTKAENENVYAMAADGQGGLWMVMARYEETGSTGMQYYSLQHVGADGQQLLHQDVTSMLTEGQDPEFSAYPQDMCVDKEGNVYLLMMGSGSKILVLDDQGRKQFEISDSEWYDGLCKSGDGRILVHGFDVSSTGPESGYALKQVDVKSKGFGEIFRGIPDGNGQFLCAPTGDDTMLIAVGSILYQYDLATQTSQEILNWIDCDINSDTIQKVTAVEDGRILAFVYNYGSENAATEAVYLKETPASEVKQKTILTYATMYLDSNVRDQIIQFNKTNADYRIEVKEYGSGDDGTALLNAAITSNDAPDIIDLSYGNVQNYISKGVLADLYPMLDGDDTLQREDFIPNVLKLYESDGKLYGVALGFSVSSLMGKTADVGTESGWTVAEVQQLLDSKPEGTQLMQYCTRETMLMVLTLMGSEGYLDWENATCSFDSQEFLDVLEFAGQFPSAENFEYSDEGVYTMISQGKLLLNEVNASSVGDYLAQAALFGEPVTCIGYPTPDGTGGSVLSPSMNFGIAADSTHKEAAWEFISSMMGYEFQKQTRWNFPLREDVLQERFEEAQSEEAGGGWQWEDFSYEVQPATDAELAAVRQLIDSAQGTTTFNEEVYSIIMEEAASYFAGQKTAAEVAKIIQGRVEIFVSENQ